MPLYLNPGPWNYWIPTTSTTSTTASPILYYYVGQTVTTSSLPMYAGTAQIGQAAFAQAQMQARAAFQHNQLQAMQQRLLREEQLAAPAVHRHELTAAQRRANELLLEHLTPEQRQCFEKNHWFIVEGGRSKQRYRIRFNNGSLIANVDLLDRDSNRVQHRLCGHCDYHAMPMEDHLLAQKLMIEHAEHDFLRIANWHR